MTSFQYEQLDTLLVEQVEQLSHVKKEINQIKSARGIATKVKDLISSYRQEKRSDANMESFDIYPTQKVPLHAQAYIDERLGQLITIMSFNKEIVDFKDWLSSEQATPLREEQY